MMHARVSTSATSLTKGTVAVEWLLSSSLKRQRWDSHCQFWRICESAE
jgi:hypothetical protein